MKKNGTAPKNTCVLADAHATMGQKSMGGAGARLMGATVKGAGKSEITMKLSRATRRLMKPHRREASA